MLDGRKRRRGTSSKETGQETHQNFSGGGSSGKPSGMQATVALTTLNIRLKSEGPIGTEKRI